MIAPTDDTEFDFGMKPAARNMLSLKVYGFLREISNTPKKRKDCPHIIHRMAFPTSTLLTFVKTNAAPIVPKRNTWTIKKN